MSIKRSVIKGTAVSGVFFGSLFYSTISAACCVCILNIEPIIAHITTEHQTTREFIVKRVNDNTNQVVSEATKAIIENFVKESRKERNAIATTVMYSAKTFRDTMIGLEQSRIRRDMEEPPGACTTSEMPANSLTANKASESYARQESSVIVQKIMADSKADPSVAYGNMASQNTNYANRGDAYSLLFGASDSSSATGNYTYNKDQLSDARSYVKDIFTGIRIPSGSDPTSKGKAIAEKGRMGIALSAFTDAIGRKSPVPSLGAAVKGGGLEQFLHSDAGAVLLNSEGGLSSSGLLAADVERRYSDPKWYADVAALSSPVSLGKEQLYMAATSLKIQHEQLKALHKIELQIAAQTLVNMTGSSSGQSGMSESQLNQIFGGL